MHNIKDKVILITGASSGIGAETARTLAAQGAKVALVARRKERLAALATELQTDGHDALAIEADVTKQTEVEAAVKTTTETFGRLDVMINNAGLMALSPLDDLKVEEWDAMIDINVKGVLYGIAAALPIFRQQDAGHFINISSIAATMVVPTSVIYCATKHAVSAITEGLRQEAGNRIRATSILPGAIESELWQGISDPVIRDNTEAFYQSHQITADQVANAIVYAISQPDDVDINQIVIRPTAQAM